MDGDDAWLLTMQVIADLLECRVVTSADVFADVQGDCCTTESHCMQCCSCITSSRIWGGANATAFLEGGHPVGGCRNSREQST